jgi:hypothetical protein
MPFAAAAHVAADLKVGLTQLPLRHVSAAPEFYAPRKITGDESQTQKCSKVSRIHACHNLPVPTCKHNNTEAFTKLDSLQAASKCYHSSSSLPKLKYHSCTAAVCCLAAVPAG